jgi:hypothetical protein
MLASFATLATAVIAVRGLFRVGDRVQSQTAQRRVDNIERILDQLAADVNAFALYSGRDAQLLATRANSRSAYQMALETIFETRTRAFAELERLPSSQQRDVMVEYVDALVRTVRAHAGNDMNALGKLLETEPDRGNNWYEARGWAEGRMEYLRVVS